MIEIVTEEARFYTGDTVVYIDETPESLLRVALDSEDAHMRGYGAAGLLRALLDTKPGDRNVQFAEAYAWATRFLLQVRGESGTTLDILPDSFPTDALVNAKLDSVTTCATKTNKPKDFSTFLTDKAQITEDLLVIGLGNWGIIAAADTFLALGKAEAIFRPIRFSVNKHRDIKPFISEAEENALREEADGRTVLVLDEDRGFGGTLRTATLAFADLLQTDTYGATPTTGRHPNWYEPGLITSQAPSRVVFDRE